MKKYDYSIRNTTNIESAQKTFNRLCDDIKSGKYKEPITDNKGNVIDGEITPERFKMAYAILDTNDTLYVCRQQLPKYWFVSPDGIIISLYHSTPSWYKGNGQGRTIFERQLRISSAANEKYNFKQNSYATIYNYVLVAIVYNSLLIGEPENIENIKKYGLETFGKKNSGKVDKNNPSVQSGARGLIINGQEIIKPDDMMDVHHISGVEHALPEDLEIMPHWLHEYLKYYTASIESIKDFERLLKKDKVAASRLTRMFNGRPYVIIDLSKTITREGKPDKHIHYDGINASRTAQVEAKYYKYFQIVPLYGNIFVFPIDLSDAALDNTDKKPVIPLLYHEQEKGFKTFGVSYIDGDKNGYRAFIMKLLSDQEYCDKGARWFLGKKEDTITYQLKSYNCRILLTRSTQSKITNDISKILS